VRALAQRSADAAKEIKKLISASSVQVEQGVKLVGQTGEALTLMAAQVAEIDVIVGEIASSAQEQATALDEVNTAVNQMDQVTQQNAAMVEETTAASQSLKSETDELVQLIGQFSLSAIEWNIRTKPTASTTPARRSNAALTDVMRTVGRGGAARKVEIAAISREDWAEF
jgi:methyl-accepting chemotaxis protein